jgi:hypothetical protein
MIKETKRNAAKYNVEINAYKHSFSSLSKSYNGKFDYVVSIGNTIAHLSPKQLQYAINKTYDLLVPKGKVFLHILNYGLIIKQKKRINNIANRDGKVIIRFYDLLNDKGLNFNILSFSINSSKNFQLVTTKHFPHNGSEINSCMKSAGFGKIKFMSNFAGEKFSEANSKDIFIKAEKKL